MYIISTDASYFERYGSGGWAYILKYPDGTERVGRGREPTNNTNGLELTAILEGLKSLPGNCRVSIYTDSQWAIDHCPRNHNVELYKVDSSHEDQQRAHHLARAAALGENNAHSPQNPCKVAS